MEHLDPKTLARKLQEQHDEGQKSDVEKELPRKREYILFASLATLKEK